MKMRLITTLLAWAACAGIHVSAQSVDLTAGPEPVVLLELYTSEGCSSCPPGEEWLSGLEHSDLLWKSVVPVAFHVDYWDYLGWRDALGSAANSDRQRRHASRWGSDTIYTPGFVLNGREWRDRRRYLRDLSQVKGGGALRVTGEIPGKIAVGFTTEAKGPWVAHAAILGGGIRVDVRAGENAGRSLAHDFAVLEWRSTATDEDGRAAFTFPSMPRVHGAKRLAIAVWIEPSGSQVPIQATGGWLNEPVAPQVP